MFVDLNRLSFGGHKPEPGLPGFKTQCSVVRSLQRLREAALSLEVAVLKALAPGYTLVPQYTLLVSASVLRCPPALTLLPSSLASGDYYQPDNLGLFYRK